MDGIFLPYQLRWILDRSPFKICEKSRRIGITWATAYEAVEVAASSKAAGGSNFWYQTYAEDDAKEFIEDCAKFAKQAGQVFETHIEELDEDESNEFFLLPEGTRSIKITSIRFRSGHRIVALSHSPRKLRGKGGVYCLDEAAFHDDMGGALKAAYAFQVWGGRVIIISTHNGVESEFNKLVEDVKAGRAEHSSHKVTLHDAVAQGLYRRVCQVRGIKWTKEEEQAWVANLLSTEGADEEFLCIPARSGGIYIARALIEAAMTPDYPVLRWAVDDEFMFHDNQQEVVEAWCVSNLDPLIHKLDYSKPHYLGQDFGRSRDGSVYAPAFEAQDLKLHVPFMVELWNMPFAAQEQVLYHLTKGLPRMTFCALDGTGNGAKLGEAAVVRYGEERAESIKMNEPWYAANLPDLKARFEDQTIVIPQDLDVRQDLGMFEVINGVPKLPKIRVGAARKDAYKGEKRHGDAGIALALATYAAKRPALAHTGYEKVSKRGGDFAFKGMW